MKVFSITLQGNSDTSDKNQQFIEDSVKGLVNTLTEAGFDINICEVAYSGKSNVEPSAASLAIKSNLPPIVKA